MRLRDFFCCCLPVPGDNSNYDERDSPRTPEVDCSNKKKSGKGIWKRLPTPSKKKLRKEAKQLRHEMADRKRKEVHLMDLILEAEDESMKVTRPVVLRKETPEENVEDVRIGSVVLVHATQHSQDVAGPAVGIPEGETGQAEAEVPLSIDLLESVYTNLSSGIDMGLLCLLVQLSKDLRKGDSCGGDQPFQNRKTPVLVPNAGELLQSHLTMHEEKEEEVEEEEEKKKEEEEEEEEEKKKEKKKEEKKEEEKEKEEEEKKKEDVLLAEEEERRLQQLSWFEGGGLAVFNTAAAATAEAATQMQYVFALFSNIFQQMMDKLYYFIKTY
ncbi:FK506-binding protein 5-like [Engraulis encrasicolus]|uniref:FK506-binding protein 5-like n=1 Tax=Engraulis encrasicolus TaxID=184585 RepID=UPI002FD1592D